MQGLTKKLEMAGTEVTARELTTLEVRNWLKELRDAEEFSVVDEMLFSDEGVSTADLLRMSDATKDLIDSLPPSEIVQLAKAVKEVNPHFFAMRQRLITLNQALA
jgi:predicted flavoprotein YhiN